MPVLMPRWCWCWYWCPACTCTDALPVLMLCVCAAADALQAAVDAAYKDQKKWTRMSILSAAGMGKFSTDRTIAEYAKDIWWVTWLGQ